MKSFKLFKQYRDNEDNVYNIRCAPDVYWAEITVDGFKQKVTLSELTDLWAHIHNAEIRGQNHE